MAASRERTEAIGLLDLALRLESIDINHDGEACSYFGVSRGKCKGCPAYERDEICIDVALADAARRIRECCYGDGAGDAAHAGGETNAAEEDDGLLRMCSKKWFEYARWVDGQGGLDDVKESVEQSECRKKLLDCFAMALGFESLEDSGDIFKELEKRLMPEGYEWPRYEGGGLVQFGDIIGMQSGLWMGHPADEMVFRADGSVEVFGDGNSVVFERGEKAMRIVLAADGEPLAPGQTVWHVDNGMEFTVSRLPNPGEYQAVEVRYRNGSSTSFDPDQLTHQRPVFDADGVPIRKGDTVWHIETGREYVVVEPSYGETVVVRLAKYDDAEGEQYAPDQLTHTKPEIDSWERLEEDAGKDCCAYYGNNSWTSCDGCPAKGIEDCNSKMARDLVRRAKKLAERDA